MTHQRIVPGILSGNLVKQEKHGRMAGTNVRGCGLDNDSRKVGDRIPAYDLYIDPPLGRAGLTEEEVRESGRRALIGRRPITKVGRVVGWGETEGLMKIIVDAETHEILGAAILGTGGDAIHSILDVMYARAPYTVIQRAMHIHPTVSEIIPTMLGELQPLSDGAGAPHWRTEK
jgi:pyruvate/2-oxoglutarate dehydrogenase complex dihydrolipoamide dehydrogenase (E3) component